MKFSHIPVLLNEVIEGLNIKADGNYLDCTMGGAGHASEILKRIKEGHLFCFEQDNDAIKKGEEVLSAIGKNYTIINDNFVNLKRHFESLNITGFDGILYDLGVSSFQFDKGSRGFSYNHDARLDMRMNQNQKLSAYEIVNQYSYADLKRIFYQYGEERFAPNIAKRICDERKKKNIETTFELSEIIKSAIPAFARRTGGHPAKKVFQALRIEVNNELQVFKDSLLDAFKFLNIGGRIAVITFHSLEDRICKQVFRSKVEVDLPRGLPIKDSEIVKSYQLINKKVITPSSEEIRNNNRAHSAKLRIIEKIEEEKQ